MGSSSSTLQEVDTNISNEITNINKNYVKLLYQSTSDIINTIHSSNTATVNNTVVCNNTSDQSDAVANGKGSIIENDQSCIMDAVNQATIDTLMNTDDATKQVQNISASVQAKLKNNSDLASDVAALNTLTQTKKTDGEINSTVDAVTGTVKGIFDDLLGKKTDNKSITKTDIKNAILQDDESSTDVSNIVNNTINSSINTDFFENCITTNTGSNINLQIRTMAIDGGIIINKQQAFLKSVNTCYIQSLLKDEMMVSVTNDVSNEVVADESSGSGVSNTAKSSIQTTFSTIASSFVGLIGNAIVQMILAGGVVIVLIIIVIMVIKHKHKTS